MQIDLKDQTKKRTAVVFLGVSVALFFLCIAMYTVIKDKVEAKQDDLVIDIDISKKSSTEPTSDPIIVPVYLTGEVKKPGIYEVEIPIYLYEIIEMAGGMTENADTKSVNLAYEINENIMINIPSKNENNNDSFTVSSNLQPSQNNNENKKININNAGLEELCNLPGVGEATAKAIIYYRENNGAFEKTEDIMNVPGIKESRFEAIRDLITSK